MTVLIDFLAASGEEMSISSMAWNMAFIKVVQALVHLYHFYGQKDHDMMHVDLGVGQSFLSWNMFN